MIVHIIPSSNSFLSRADTGFPVFSASDLTDMTSVVIIIWSTTMGAIATGLNFGRLRALLYLSSSPTKAPCSFSSVFLDFLFLSSFAYVLVVGVFLRLRAALLHRYELGCSRFCPRTPYAANRTLSRPYRAGLTGRSRTNSRAAEILLRPSRLPHWTLEVAALALLSRRTLEIAALSLLSLRTLEIPVLPLLPLRTLEIPALPLLSLRTLEIAALPLLSWRTLEIAALSLLSLRTLEIAALSLLSLRTLEVAILRGIFRFFICRLRLLHSLSLWLLYRILWHLLIRRLRNRLFFCCGLRCFYLFRHFCRLCRF